MNFADGYIAVVKRDCPTCVALEPVYADLRARGVPLTIYSQDDPTFPESTDGALDDRSLEHS